MKTLSLFTISCVALLVWTSSANAGVIVVHNDEWQLSNTGFAQAGSSNVTTYIQNVAAFLGSGGGPGNYLVYSSDFSLNESGFANAMAAAGHSVTFDSTGSTDMTVLANLLPFDGIFFAGFQPYDLAVLTNYVGAGGGVHVSLGTTSTTFSGTFWNPFLESFGITVNPNTNTIAGVIPMAGLHPVTAGVAQLYQLNGNSLSLTGSTPFAQIIETHNPSGDGLIAVFDGGAAVPEPSTVILLGLGLALFAIPRLRKKLR